MKFGIKASNGAMSDFSSRLKQLSDADFQDLITGMDVLAVNSLTLIRNNSDEFIAAIRSRMLVLKTN
jgi:hypothetical protein